MDILESTIKERLIAKRYHKPRIEVGNYYLKWNGEESYGIQENEISEVKGFLKNAIPFFDVSYGVMNNLEKSDYKNKYHRYEELFPCLCLLHRNKDHTVSYELHMTTDGSTFIDRIEKIKAIDTNIDNDDNNLLKSKYNTRRSQCVKRSIINLKWNLGELLFNRQGDDTRNKG
jgi:hypothetical protein